MGKLPSQKERSKAATKASHARRRAANLCIYDAREFGKPEHGPPHRGGRCVACWDAKLESQRRRRLQQKIERARQMPPAQRAERIRRLEAELERLNRAEAA